MPCQYFTGAATQFFKIIMIFSYSYVLQICHYSYVLQICHFLQQENKLKNSFIIIPRNSKTMMQFHEW